MNILVINGSPRKTNSNSFKLTKAFIDGMSKMALAKDNISPSIEVLEASTLKINPCLGCFSCWNMTPGQCVIKDKMSLVIEKLLWADIIIWSFPLYYYNVPGGLKNLIDRQLPMVMPTMLEDTVSGGHPGRYDMSNKKTVLISTCGFYTSKGNYDSVTSMFDRMQGEGTYTTLFCGEGELFSIEAFSTQTDNYLKSVSKAGEEFYIDGEISSDTRKLLEVPLLPRETFEALSNDTFDDDDEDQPSNTLQKEVESSYDEEALKFTKEMALLYNTESYQGEDVIIDMNYTDINKAYRIVLGKDKATVETTLDDSFFDKDKYTSFLMEESCFGRDKGSGGSV